MAVFLALLPALLCMAIAGYIYGGAFARALMRNAVLLDIIGDVLIQLMLGGPLIAYVLSQLGVVGGLDANPGMAIVWMVSTIVAAYYFKRAARNAEALRNS